MRRFFWFISGVAAGISTFVWAKKKVTIAANKMSPAGIARRGVANVRGFGERLGDAVRAGRDVMAQKEQRVRTKRQR